jgi:hypothetical protein
MKFNNTFLEGRKNQCKTFSYFCRSHWPRGLSRGSAAARLLLWRVKIRPGDIAILFVSFVCCQRFLCRANHSSRAVLSSVVRRNKRDPEASIMRSWHTSGCWGGVGVGGGNRVFRKREY